MSSELTYYIAWVYVDENGNEIPLIASPMTNVINGLKLEATNDSEAVSLGRLVWLEAVSSDHEMSLRMPLYCQYAGVYASTAPFPLDVPTGLIDPTENREYEAEDMMGFFQSSRLVSKLDGIPIYLPYAVGHEMPSPWDGNAFNADEYMVAVDREIWEADNRQKSLEGWSSDRYLRLYAPISRQIHQAFADMVKAQISALNSAGIDLDVLLASPLPSESEDSPLIAAAPYLAIPEAQVHALTVASAANQVRLALMQAAAAPPKHIQSAVSPEDIEHMFQQLENFLKEGEK